ncbi:uncharacterized protein LOC125655506 [Ostrea edulis]|uniref:uncharacterized protein LOC125655506 n=1 Tax=Ostrea edulis TaxID=37623 RepID=UPI0020951A2A|nr:uncharacterized protein LOC125655506 [Ostrea edulis]
MSSGGSNVEESTEYSKYGIRDAPKTAIVTPLGQTRTCAKLNAKEAVFLVVSIVNILTALGLTLYRFITVIKEGKSDSSDFTFALILIINGAFCIFYVLHGLLREKKYELYVLILAVLVVLVYCVVEYIVNVRGRSTLKLVRLILAVVLAPPNVILAWSVASHFGYLTFRIVGASEYLQHLFKQASIFSSLLKFDVQVTASFVVLVLKDGTELNDFQIVALSVGLPYSVLWNIYGWITLRREWKTSAWIFAFLGLAKPSYYIYQIIREFNRLNEDAKIDEIIVYSSLVAGTLALLIWLIIMIELVTVYRNFGKGLRERAFDVLASENTSLITGRRVHR